MIATAHFSFKRQRMLSNFSFSKKAVTSSSLLNQLNQKAKLDKSLNYTDPWCEAHRMCDRIVCSLDQLPTIQKMKIMLRRYEKKDTPIWYLINIAELIRYQALTLYDPG